MWDAKGLGAYSCVEEWPRLSGKAVAKVEVTVRMQDQKFKGSSEGRWSWDRRFAATTASYDRGRRRSQQACPDHLGDDHRWGDVQRGTR